MARGRHGLSVDVDAIDLRKMLSDLAPNEARNILRATVHGVAGQVRDELKRRIPKDSRAGEKSIKAVRRRGEPDHPVSDVRGGDTAPYLLMLEYGTSKTRAQPFITPTVESTRPDLARIYREQFLEKLKESLARRAKRMKA